MAVSDHPTPQQERLLDAVDSLHLDPGDLAENLTALRAFGGVRRPSSFGSGRR